MTEDRAVSLNAVIDAIEYFQINPQHFDFVNLIDDIKELPSVSQLQKGYWINNDNGIMSCSECHTWFNRDCQSKFMNYCGYCGTRMEGNNDGR